MESWDLLLDLHMTQATEAFQQHRQQKSASSLLKSGRIWTVGGIQPAKLELNTQKFAPENLGIYSPASATCLYLAHICPSKLSTAGGLCSCWAISTEQG